MNTGREILISRINDNGKNLCLDNDYKKLKNWHDRCRYLKQMIADRYKICSEFISLYFITKDFYEDKKILRFT